MKAIFWDIDGTLLNTESLHRKCLITVCNKADFSVEDKEISFGISHYDLWDILDLHHYFESKEEWLRLIYAEYQLNSDLIKIREGILNILLYLRTLEIKQAVVSNAVREIVDLNLTQTSLAHFFECSISRNNVSNPKPDGEPYQAALKHFNLNLWEALAVEDTPLGIQAAKNAGLIAVAFPNEHTEKMDFRLADFVIQHPRQLIEIIAQKK
jgi:HAD superfamily hydrolase (TIGR01509 family)